MPESERTRAAHLQLLAVSWNFGWPIAAGVALGYWIDQGLGTSPAATLLLGIGALAAATFRLVRLSRIEQQARSADGPVAPADTTGPAPAQRWDEEAEQWVDDWNADDSDGGPR